MKQIWRSLAGALGFGVITQALFWDAPIGLNLALFAILVIAASALSKAPSRSGWLLAILGVLSAGSIAAHDSDWTLLFGVPTTAALLVCAVASPSSVADVPAALARFFGRMPSGAVTAARTIPAAVGADARPFVVRGLLGVGLGLPIAGLFGGLLATDESFRDTVTAASGRIGTAGGFTIASIATAFGALVVFAAVKAVRALGAPGLGPYRTDPYALPALPGTAPRPTLSLFTWGVVLAQVALVFAVFAIANARHLFGGVASIHAEKSLTYAAYLHSGFAELVIASSCSVGLVIAGHALVTPYGERVVRGGRALAGIELTVLGLSALTLASCAQRLFIYEDAYGATYKRLGVLVVGIMVLGGLAVTAIKSVRRSWSGWGGATMVTVLAILTGASLYDADGHVARKNLERADAGKPVDMDYLASLGPDARSTLGAEYLAQNPENRADLDRAWQSPPTGWRSKRGLLHRR